MQKFINSHVMKGEIFLKNILIVDDEVEILELLKVYLSNNNFNVWKAHDGEKALEIFRSNDIHLVILDIMMPKIDGIETVKRLRKESNVPIMFLSAKGEDMDIIHGLGVGADDYMSKPFNPLEVVARVQALLRRFNHLNNGNNKECIRIGDLYIDPDYCQVYKNSKEVIMTSMEYKLLLFFMQNPGRVFTKVQLYEQVWGQDYIGNENIIMVYISKLREKIEENPKKPIFLKTIRGIGYRFERNI